MSKILSPLSDLFTSPYKSCLQFLSVMTTFVHFPCYMNVIYNGSFLIQVWCLFIYLMKNHILYCDIHILLFNVMNMKNISKVLLVIKSESESDLLNMDTNDSTVVLRGQSACSTRFLAPSWKPWPNEFSTSLRIYFIRLSDNE